MLLTKMSNYAFAFSWADALVGSSRKDVLPNHKCQRTENIPVASRAESNMHMPDSLSAEDSKIDS